MRRMILPVPAVAMLAVVMLAGGCTTVGRSAPPAPTSSAAPTGVALPPRPRDVPLDGVDPCSLLTPTQRTTLGLQKEPYAFESTAPLFRGPACTVGGVEPYVSAGIAIVLGNGIGAITGPDAAGTLEPITVAGFPAVLAYDVRHPEDCSVDVDLNPGQFLDLQYRDDGNTPDIPQQQLCRRGVIATEAALTTLFGR